MTDKIGEKKFRASRKYWIEKKGQLYARLQYTNEQGEYREKYRRIEGKRDAIGAVEAMRRELDENGEESLHADKITFSELADKYDEVELVPAVYQNGIKIQGKRSVNSVKSAMKPLREYFGKRAIRSIKASDLKAYKNKRLNTPVEIEVKVKTKVVDEQIGKEKTIITKTIRTRERKIVTINRELAWMRAILNFAIDNDRLLKNPFSKAKGIISLAAEVERDRVLSFTEEELLLSVCTDEREHLRAIIICALDTAMRRGEILKTRWRDVNFETGEIYIRKEISKTGFDRTVGITARLKTELVRLWEWSPKNPGMLVFGIKNDFSNAFETARSKAGLKDFRFHDCRYTPTTRMITSGSPHVEVMKITGHRQLKTFLRYLNITQETAQKCASRLDEYFVQSKPMQQTESNFTN
jgi:integrase